MSKKWTKEKLDQEAEEMQIKEDDNIEIGGMRPPRKSGRPRKGTMVKTNVDLSEDLLDDLDRIAAYMGVPRQGVIKSFVLNGVNEFFNSQAKKKMIG